MSSGTPFDDFFQLSFDALYLLCGLIFATELNPKILGIVIGSVQISFTFVARLEGGLRRWFIHQQARFIELSFECHGTNLATRSKTATITATHGNNFDRKMER